MLKLGRKDPKQGRSKETVEAIFGAVTHILNRDGVEGLTTNKIAEVAGVSVGSLYQYFKNKESIYEGILLRVLEDNLTRVETTLLAIDPGKITIREIVAQIINNQFESFEKMNRVATLLLQFAPKLIPISHFQKVDERIIQFLIEQIEKHKVQVAPVNKEAAFFICSQAVRSVVLMAFLGKNPEERMKIKHELIEMLAGYLEGQQPLAQDN